MSSSRNALYSNNNPESDQPKSDLKVDEQSYFTTEKDITIEDEKKTNEYAASYYYIERDSNLATHQQYYEASYEDADEVPKRVANSQGYYADNEEGVNGASDTDSAQRELASEASKQPTNHPHSTLVETLNGSRVVSRAGSVRQLITQFQNIIETNEMIKHQTTRDSSETKVVEESTEKLAPTQSGTINLRGTPTDQNHCARVNISLGSRAVASEKGSSVTLDDQRYARGKEDKYDNAALNDDTNSEDENTSQIIANQTAIRSIGDEGHPPGDSVKSTLLYNNNEQAYSTGPTSLYIIDVEKDVTTGYEEVLDDNSANESDVSSESSEADVNDDTFDYYKQHEAFKDIMATEQRDWHNEAMIIQKEYGTSIEERISCSLRLEAFVTIPTLFVGSKDIISLSLK